MVAITEAARQRARLSAELQKMPSELVTTDHADGDKIHNHDAPHIVRGMLKQLAREQAQGYKTPPPVIVKQAAQLRFIALCHDTDNKLPLNQSVVDIIRAKLLGEVSVRVLRNANCAINDFRVRHVWFPALDRGRAMGASRFELRDGPAPREAERPALLKGLALEVDVLDWPRACVDALDSVRGFITATEAKARNVHHRLKLGLAAESPLILPPSSIATV